MNTDPRETSDDTSDDTDVTMPGDEPRTESADAAMIRRARERHGTLGGMVAGGMLGLDKIFERPAKEEIPAVWEASGETLDIDDQGISVEVEDGREVHSHPGAAAPRRIVKRRRG